MARKLLNKSKNVEVAHTLHEARSFWQRTKGLLGEKTMPNGSALLIQGSRFIPCNSIHTLFMRFAIDAVFVDRHLVVKAVYQDLVPWRLTWPAVGASSVFELPAGTLKKASVEIGDQLHVGD